MNDNTDNLLWYANPDMDAPAEEGNLKELRVALRPNLSVLKWPINAGSQALENYRPLEDAAVVKRIRGNGARLIGMGKMSELGFGIVSETAHMLLANKKCDAALGTDLTGECRYLATLAGAWGYKPSFGICSNLGVISLIPSMESVGIIANDLKGIEAIVSEISGKEPLDFTMLWEKLPDFAAARETNPKTGTIGIITEQIDQLPEADRKAFDSAMATLTGKGLRLKEVSFPDYDLFKMVHQIAGSVEASSSAGKYDSVRYGHRAKDAPNWNEMYLKSRQESFGPLIKAYLFQGAFFQFQNYAAFEHACRLRNLLTEQLEAVFADIDFIVSPVRLSNSNAASAVSVEDVYAAFSLTLPANVAGLPSLSVPGIVMSGDMDMGLQVTGPHLSDKRLLDFAGAWF